MKSILLFMACLALACAGAYSAPPANDNFAQAQVLTTDEVVAGTLVDATREPGDPEQPHGTVWYQWAASKSGIAKVGAEFQSTNGGLDVLVGSSALSSTFITKDDAKVASFYAVKGQLYRICLHSFGDNTFTVGVSFQPSSDLPEGTQYVAPLSNDNLQNATPLSSATHNLVLYTLNADEEGDEQAMLKAVKAAYFKTAAIASVWLAWTPPVSGTATITATTVGANAINRRVAIVVATGPANSIASLHLPVSALYNTGTFSCTAGTTYYIYLLNQNEFGLFTQLSVVAAPAPIITVSGDLSFGDVPVGSHAQKTLTITNNGNAALSISSVNYPSGFTGNYNGTIAAGSSHDVTVTFSPNIAGAFSGTVTVNSNATRDANTIAVFGTGTPVVPPPSFHAGSFGGLLESGNGYVKLALKSNGRFTGVVFVDGASHRLQGTLDGNGDFAGSSKPPLPFTLHVNESPSDYFLSGSAGGEAFTVRHAAYVKGETLPETGKYTLLLAASVSDATVPPGCGYATLVVGKTGGIRIAGKLPDGTSFGSSTILLEGLAGTRAAIYRRLNYPSVTGKGEKGLLVGSVTFKATSDAGFDGSLQWVKPQQSKGTYPGGLDTSLNVDGSSYTFAGGDSALPGFTSGTLTLSDSDHQLDKAVTLTSTNAVVVTEPAMDKLKVKINTASGLFSGSFVYPGKTGGTKFAGALFQEGAKGGGFYFGPNGGGKVSLHP